MILLLFLPSLLFLSTICYLSLFHHHSSFLNFPSVFTPPTSFFVYLRITTTVQVLDPKFCFQSPIPQPQHGAAKTLQRVETY